MEIPRKHRGFFSGRQPGGAIGMGNLLRSLSQESCGEPILGYHALMTEPYFYYHRHQPFQLDEFELLTAELSARLWKRYNGPIRMVTDSEGYGYLQNTPLFEAYDEVLPILNRQNYGILPYKYWASGKLQALAKISAPCVLIDMDLMVWQPLRLYRYPLACAHIEHIQTDIYPERDFFHMDADYSFPPEWDWTVEPLNTSIVYFSDDAFKNEYARQSIRFMRSEKESPDNGVICMVFAEQRILAMCAAAKGIVPHTFLDYDCLEAPQKQITHIWGAKRHIRTNPDVYAIYTALCREKLRLLRE